MEGFLRYFWIKLSGSIPLCFIAFTQSTTDIIWGIIYIVMLDTILGVWVALRYKVFSSHCLSRFFTKISTYTVAMLSMFILSALEPEALGWVFRWTGLFIILTELFSNFEKLSLLGFKVPTKLLSKINKQFEGFLNEDESREKIAEKIIENRNNK